VGDEHLIGAFGLLENGLLLVAASLVVVSGAGGTKVAPA